jgi:hypothetical protein
MAATPSFGTRSQHAASTRGCLFHFRIKEKVMAYDPNEARDHRGRWSSNGQGATIASQTPSGFHPNGPAPTAVTNASDQSTTGGTMRVILRNGAIKFVEVPPGASPEKTAELCGAIAGVSHGTKERLMYGLFHRGGPLDYQRAGGKAFDLKYKDYSSYSYGVGAAAAGYSNLQAGVAAGLYNTTGSGKKSGPYFMDQEDYDMMWAGMRDYRAGKFSPASP